MTESGGSAAKRPRSVWSSILRCVVSAALLGAVVWLVGPERIASAARGARWSLVGAAALLSIPIVWSRAIRWRLLARCVVPDVSRGEVWRSYLSGLALGLITPGGAGELARAWTLPRGDRVALTSLAALDKMANLSWVAAAAGLGFAAAGVIPVALGVALAAVVPAAWFAAFRLSRRLGNRESSGRIVRALRAWGALPVPTLVAVAVWSGGGFACYFVQAWVLLRAFDPAVSFGAVGLWPAVTLSSALPSLAGGLGPREATAALLLPRVGVSAEVAAAASVLQMLLVTALPALPGAFFLGSATNRPRRA